MVLPFNVAVQKLHFAFGPLFDTRNSAVENVWQPNESEIEASEMAGIGY